MLVITSTLPFVQQSCNIQETTNKKRIEDVCKWPAPVLPSIIILLTWGQRSSILVPFPHSANSKTKRLPMPTTSDQALEAQDPAFFFQNGIIFSFLLKSWRKERVISKDVFGYMFTKVGCWNRHRKRRGTKGKQTGEKWAQLCFPLASILFLMETRLEFWTI